MSVGGKVIEVMDQYDLIWINIVEGTDAYGIYVVSDENSKRINKGDFVVWRGDFAYWTASAKGAHKGVRIKRVGKSRAPRPEPTAISVMQKERKRLIDESKGLECEIRTQSDRYEQEINRLKTLHKETTTRISSALANCRIYAFVITVIAFVSTYLHFG